MNVIFIKVDLPFVVPSFTPISFCMAIQIVPFLSLPFFSHHEKKEMQF